jgi:hypothetical protein
MQAWQNDFTFTDEKIREEVETFIFDISVSDNLHTQLGAWTSQHDIATQILTRGFSSEWRSVFIG